MQPISPLDPRTPRRRWFWFGCLPAIGVVLLAAIIVAAFAASERNAPVTRSNGTVLSPNTVTTPVPGSAAVTASCAVQQGLVTRECAIITPPGVEAGTKLPVVFLLHGFGDGPVEVRGEGAWADAVVAHRFMLVTPSGVFSSWNAGGCCGLSRSTEVDDVGYLAALVDEISRRPDVDPARVFMAGFSNGGMMVYRYLCVDGTHIRAAASVSGTKSINCTSKRPTSFLHIHGTGDETVPYTGGAGVVATLMGSSFQPVASSMDHFAATDDGCTAAPAEKTAGDLTTKEWDGCAGGTRVKLITIAKWPHQWPLTGPLDATDEVLRFFGID